MPAEVLRAAFRRSDIGDIIAGHAGRNSKPELNPNATRLLSLQTDRADDVIRHFAIFRVHQPHTDDRRPVVIGQRRDVAHLVILDGQNLRAAFLVHDDAAEARAVDKIIFDHRRFDDAENGNADTADVVMRLASTWH